ncbi:uncharacterized protein [Drosophila kikkawai]|uniref:Uncharacterized protein n=1 Tax=Drosophila kikkawai TaxID=30033 RepID=A0A6P4HT12_DROKI|nr:uncharacterized protein LOC108072525 [Drosophila kikkawai]
MYSCCCRSRGDRTDPMACLPSFPRLQRSSFLEGRQGSSCLSTKRRWGLMNVGMIQALAKMVNQSTERVGQFLHQLTLQLFARILQPLMAGWNTRKIPFTLPDTCELYYGIFDECGNIRCPIPTRTLLILITMMQYFLNLPRECGRKIEGLKRRCKCGSTEDSLKDIHNPGYCRNVVLFGGPRTPRSEPSPRSVIWAGLRRLGYDRSSAGLQSFSSDESIPYGYAPHLCPCQGSGAPRKPAVSQYANISGPMAWQTACERELQSPLLVSDCKQRAPLEQMSPKQVQCYCIANISDLYTAVVQNQHSRQLLTEIKPRKPRIIPCRQEKSRCGGGMMMIPQPYCNSMPWSWLHRDPKKAIQLPNGRVMTLYGGQLIKKGYQRLGCNYDQVKPLRENRLLPDGYSPQDSALQALKPYRPQERVYFTTDNCSKALHNLPQIGYTRDISGQLEDQVNQARLVKDPLDYCQEMMEIDQLRVHKTWSFSRPLSPISSKRIQNNSISKNVLKSNYLERSKIPKRSNQDSSLEPEKANPVKKILQTRNIVSPEASKVMTPDYSGSGEYRKDTDKENSRTKKDSRKVAGESLFFISPARVITSQLKLVKPNMFHSSSMVKSLMNQKSIQSFKSLEKKVHFPVPTIREMQEEPIKPYKYKTKSRDHTQTLHKLYKRSSEENYKEKMNRKAHFQRNILRNRSISRERTKTQSRESKSPESKLRFPNLFLALSRKINERSGNTKEMGPRNIRISHKSRVKTTE